MSMQNPLYNTILKDRTLWYDGDSSYPSSKLIQTIKKGYKVSWADAITPAIKQYNMVSDTTDQISIKIGCNELTKDWNIPDEYKNMDVVQYVIDKHDVVLVDKGDAEIASREIRLANELVKFQKTNFEDVLRTIIYIINRLTSAGIVWGVGRGSSVSSYILYVIGVHDVDSYAYELDIDDFLHD